MSINTENPQLTKAQKAEVANHHNTQKTINAVKAIHEIDKKFRKNKKLDLVLEIQKFINWLQERIFLSAQD